MAVSKNPPFLGVGFLAYTLGLRHAFDADHISAIDNTVRKLIQQKRSTYGVGFWFSLGHSTVVFLMSFAVILSIKWATSHMSIFKKTGSIVGTTVSGLFLMLVGLFNILVLINLLRSLRQVKQAKSQAKKIDTSLTSSGLLSKLYKPLFRVITKSHQMYPIGFLFGLGFDTATEITLLALAAQSSQQNISLFGLMSLPLLFTAGMNLLDTTDSVMMTRAYQWAFKAPLRKLYYNIVVTGISIIAAVTIGLTELLQVTKNTLNLNSTFWLGVSKIDFNWLGFGLVALFITVWGFAYLIWKTTHQNLKTN